MGSCIICGSSTDGEVCPIHEEDVAFIFEGDSPHQLTPNRYYRGTVDGFADFGVFINIGDSVTGLLHRNELDQRIESLDWEVSDTVYVQVKNIRDNGNVDLGWSVRQAVNEFRGSLVDTPNGDLRRDDDRSEDEETTQQDEETTQQESEPSVEPDSTDVESQTSSEEVSQDGPASPIEQESDDQPEPDTSSEQSGRDFEIATISSLSDRVNDAVRVEGEVTGVRQTSGPTLFEVRDETGTIECAAFEGAGVRAFPEIDVGDYVRLDGVVEYRHDDIQVETETILQLAGEERDAVAGRIESAISEAVRPDQVTYPIEDDPASVLERDIHEAATVIRKAIKNARPVIVRHAATIDGYAAGAALERAALPLIREEHSRSDAEYHYFKRRPLDNFVYGMSSVTGDVSNALETCERYGERKPLMVLVGVGSTNEAKDAFEMLDVYNINRVVIDDTRPADDITSAAEAVVNPHLVEATNEQLTTTAMSTAVAATINDEIADDLQHLPAISYWHDGVLAYETAAESAGYDQDYRRQLKDALALEAHYQSYNDKRELIQNLLFGKVDDLVAHIAEQSRERLETSLQPARENLSRKESGGVTFLKLDTDSFTHRFDYPPTELLLDELHRQEQTEIGGPLVTLGYGTDELHVRSTETIDLQAIVDRASEVVPSVSGVGGKDGYVQFLSGVREDALDAIVGAIANEVGSQ